MASDVRGANAHLLMASNSTGDSRQWRINADDLFLLHEILDPNGKWGFFSRHDTVTLSGRVTGHSDVNAW